MEGNNKNGTNKIEGLEKNSNFDRENDELRKKYPVEVRQHEIRVLFVEVIVQI